MLTLGGGGVCGWPTAQHPSRTCHVVELVLDNHPATGDSVPVCDQLTGTDRVREPVPLVASRTGVEVDQVANLRTIRLLL